MTIGTTRFFQNNTALFSRLNDELELLQVQAGSGQADLKLSKNYRDVAQLSAAEEMKSKTQQFIDNAKRVETDLEHMDLVMERLQDLLIRLQEVCVESGNDILSTDERTTFIAEAKMLKSEFLDLANSTDSFGNALFGGVAGSGKAYEISNHGAAKYLGSVVSKNVQVSDGLNVRQNFSGTEVFENIESSDGKFSIFQLVDDVIESLEIDLSSTSSSKLQTGVSSALIEFPDTGADGEISLTFATSIGESNFSFKIYGNDYSDLADAINADGNLAGITATYEGDNRILLGGDIDQLKIKNFSQSGMSDPEAKLAILDANTYEMQQEISQTKLNNSVIRLRISDAFTHVSEMRSEVASSSRRANEAKSFNEDLLMELQTDISNIRDADLASILTKIEMLMLQKDAAQATFTRITSRSLFDLLG